MIGVDPFPELIMAASAASARVDSRPGRFLTLLAFDGQTPGFPPRLETPVEVGDPGVAENLQHVGGERRAAAGGAVEDGPPAGVELGPVVGAGGVGGELEHPARGVDRSGDAAVLPRSSASRRSTSSTSPPSSSAATAAGERFSMRAFRLGDQVRGGFRGHGLHSFRGMRGKRCRWQRDYAATRRTTSERCLIFRLGVT